MGNYDPTQYETWPQEQKDFAGKVADGLANGDMKPLAAYIRAGHYLEPALAAEIADMLDSNEGYTPFRLQAIGRSNRPGGWKQWSEQHHRMEVMGIWVEREIRRSPRGAYAGIIEDACEIFQVGKTSVTKAHKLIREQLDSATSAPGFDLFAHLINLYSTELPNSAE
ncbi:MULTISPECIES: hypothetical protein [unclassified Sphingobium]|uniref:hypothetical protein n=1 Tax=unclassified Sphingobium TaxID=2611147 RepID=UPI0035A6D4D8